MAMPAIAAVRAAHPQAHLAIAAPAAFVGFCAAIPGVDGVVGLPGSGLRALGAHAAALAAGRFDVALLCTNSYASALAAKPAGIPGRWGYRRDWRGPLLTRAVRRRARRTAAPAPGPAGPHHSAYYLRLAAALDMPAVEAPVGVSVPADAASRAGVLLAEAGVAADARLVAFAPGAAYGSAKRWPPERVAAAASALAARGARPVLVGAGADREIARAIQSALDPAARSAVVDLVGRTDVATLMAVLAR